MRVYALTRSRSPNETLDLFVAKEAAEAELREILSDEPDWKDSASCRSNSTSGTLRRTSAAQRA